MGAPAGEAQRLRGEPVGLRLAPGHLPPGPPPERGLEAGVPARFSGGRLERRSEQDVGPRVFSSRGLG